MTLQTAGRRHVNCPADRPVRGRGRVKSLVSAFDELKSATQSIGINTAGAWFAHGARSLSDEVPIRAGVPADSSVSDHVHPVHEPHRSLAAVALPKNVA